MDPTLLPEEVAERIFILLPVKDVLSCCLVSSLWREAVNKNVIWKMHCSPNINLENLKSIVKPEFQVPKFDCEELTPICKYRLKYMQEIHLRNNFRNNRCIEYKFSKSRIEKIEFLDNYLLLNDSYKNEFHVWDIRGKPYLVQSVPYLLQQMCTQTFQSLGNCLLIVQCNLLQIYVIVDGKMSLKMCRLFDREEAFSHTIPAPDGLSMWYSTHIGLYPCDFNSHNEIVGEYFIGIVESQCLNKSVMHIWNLDSGKKLKEDSIPVVTESIECISCGNNSKFLYIALYLSSSSGTRCKIVSYNLKELQYTEFCIESNHSIPFMLYEEKVVVLPCDQWENSGSYIFLDSISGETIAVKEFDNPINPKVLDVHNSIMVFGSSNTVTVVDLTTQEEVLVFTVNYEVNEVYLLDFNMLLVGGVAYHFVLEVWDIKKNCRLYTLDEKSSLLCSRRLSTLSLQSLYNIHVLHYW